MVYGMQIITSNIEFAESKNAADNGGFGGPAGGGYAPGGNGGFEPAGGQDFSDSSKDFMSIDDGIKDDIPF